MNFMKMGFSSAGFSIFYGEKPYWNGNVRKPGFSYELPRLTFTKSGFFLYSDFGHVTCHMSYVTCDI